MDKYQAAENDNQSAQQSVQRLEADAMNLREELKHSAADMKELLRKQEEVSGQLDEVNKMKLRLEEENRELAEKGDSVRLEMKQMKGEINSLQRERDELKNFEQKYEEAKACIDDLNTQITDMKDKVRSYQAESFPFFLLSIVFSYFTLHLFLFLDLSSNECRTIESSKEPERRLG